MIFYSLVEEFAVGPALGHNGAHVLNLANRASKNGTVPAPQMYVPGWKAT